MMRYPKVFRCQDGRSVLVRPAGPSDLDALLEFFNGLPDEDLLHLRVDVTQRDIMKRRMDPPPHYEAVRLIAMFGNQVVAEASLARRTYGFESHVGDVRFIVAPDYRRSGLASFLGRQIFAHAIVMDLEKVEAEVMADDEDAIRLVEQLGFERDGLLESFVKDIKGNNHDLLIMSLRI